MYDLTDKIVLITGAAKGIGAAMAIEVLKEGAQHVRILDVDETAGVQFQNELNDKYGANKAKFVKCDVSNDDQLFEAFNDTKETQGHLDLVINNAALANESNYAAIRKLIEVNYIALVNGTLKAIELMDKNKGGRGGTVINISSVAGLFPTYPPLFTYSSSKSAVLQFTGCIGKDPFHSETGVRVIALCFGVTDTTIFDNMNSYEAKEVGAIANSLGRNVKQSIESAAKGAVEAYKKGKSGSIWIIRDNKSAIDASPELKKCYEIMTSLKYRVLN